MRIILIALFSLFTSVTFANFKIGDSTTLKTTFDFGDGNLEVTYLKQTIIKVEPGRALIESSDVTISGEVIGESYQDWENTDEIVSKEDGMNTVKNCNLLDGTTEKLNTAIGNILTCKTVTEDSTVWVGPVLFGVVKVIRQSDEFSFTTEIVSQSN